MFITSNTWLDTSYGKRLQQGLLELTDLKYIIDNRKRRSFENADVNTVITTAKKTTERYLEGGVQFAAFREPYEQVGTPDHMTKLFVDSAGVKSNEFAIGNDRAKIKRFDKLRNVSITEEVLWRLGEGTISETQEKLHEATQSSDRPKPSGTYNGNKWGQFLRAPSAHFDLLEAGSNVLVPLSEIAEVGSYLNTGGADDFFFVDISSGNPVKDDFVMVRNRETGDTFEVESEFVVPFVESPGKIKQIDVSNNKFDSYIISISKEANIRSKKIGKYVKWGEAEGKEYDQASGRKNKKEWWVLGQRAETNTEIVWPNRQNDRHFVAYNPERTVTHRFYRIKPKEGVNLTSKELAALLNFSPTSLFTEVLASAGLGQGVLDVTGTTLRRVPVVDPKALSENIRARILESFDEMAERTMGSMHQELGSESGDSINIDSIKEDRRNLDKTIFEDCFKIDTGSQQNAYSAILRTINARINKSESV